MPYPLSSGASSFRRKDVKKQNDTVICRVGHRVVEARFNSGDDEPSERHANGACNALTDLGSRKSN
eukprot:3656932-Rhodomonas_salina.2